MNSEIKPIKLFDTYKKHLVEIKPEETVEPGKIKLYSCGPTVYGYMHIGNLRAAWLPDTIERVANLTGWKVDWVLNITDVGHLVDDGDDGEDKIEKGAKRDGKSVQEIVDFYTQDYLNQAKAIRINLPNGKHNPKASEYIQGQMLLALNLLSQFYAYVNDDGIYFDYVASELHDVAARKNHQLGNKLKNNSKYTGRKIVGSDEKDPRDFALWKFVDEKSLQKWKFEDYPKAVWIFEQARNNLKLRSPQFDKLELGDKISFNAEQSDYLREVLEFEKTLSRWGCPGWHSECVAMICEILGENIEKLGLSNYLTDLQKTNPENMEEKKPSIIDIHTGGEDHIPVHHKNEILQSESLGFHLSKYWVHNKFVTVDEKKMSKSLGNVFQIVGDSKKTGFPSFIEKDYDPLAYRLMLFEHHYGEQMNFTWEKLEQSQNRLHNLRKESAKLTSFIVQQDRHIDTEFEDILKLEDKWLEILVNDLNLPKFLEEYQEYLLRIVNSMIKSQKISKKSYELLLKFDKQLLQLDLFDFIVPSNVKDLAHQRWQSKLEKDYQNSDKLRKQIESLNFKVDDYAWGYGIWKNK